MVIRRSFRIGLLLGLLGGVAFALTKVLGNQGTGAPALARTPEPWPRLTTDPASTAPPIARPVPDPVTEPAAEPVVEAAVAEPPAGDPILDAADAAPEPPATKKAATKKAPAKKAAALKAWVEPSGGVCPTTHPVKAKLASKIFHLPGMLNYDRTNPDRCYVDGAKAEADGLRAAKR